MARRRTQTEQDDFQLRETATAALSRPTDLWMESQATFFEHFDEVARRWLDRRREALDATRQSLDEMRRTSDVGDVFRIQQEWISGAMRRLAADLGELSQAALTMTQTATHQLGRTAEGAVHDADQVSREMMSAAGSKPGNS